MGCDSRVLCIEHFSRRRVIMKRKIIIFRALRTFLRMLNGGNKKRWEKEDKISIHWGNWHCVQCESYPVHPPPSFQDHAIFVTFNWLTCSSVTRGCCIEMHNWNIYHLYPATVLWFISDSGSRWRGDNGWGDTDGWERGRYPQMCWLSVEIESGPCQSWSYQPRHSYSWLGPTFNNESNNRLLWLNCAPSQAHHKYQGWSLINNR